MSKLLLISSSKVGDSGYLETAQTQLYNHFGVGSNVIFVPFAGVSIGWDEYTSKVQEALPQLNVTGIHSLDEPFNALQYCDGIMVGGGNTFRLLNELYQQDLLHSISRAVERGLSYAGWSAGSNIAGKTIRTTNDMPIIEPTSFNALGLLPFQINPHYTNETPDGHNGESRDDRLGEFMVLNPLETIIAIPEGTALVQQENKLFLEGANGGFKFCGGEKTILNDQTDLSYLLKD